MVASPTTPASRATVRSLPRAWNHPTARNATSAAAVAHRNQPVYRAVGAAHLHDLLFSALRDHLAGHGARLPVEIVAEYHASALVGVLGWWVRAGFPHGPEAMARMCREMTQPGVMAALTEIHAGG